MKKQILAVMLTFLLISTGIAIVSAAANTTITDCKNLYWFDNDNSVCAKKQFCGAYMYYGLQTFESKSQCEKALNNTKNSTNNASEKGPKNVTFIPWQKRNYSECMEGCKCVGAVMSCITENGKTLTISTGSGKVIILEVGLSKAYTTLEVEQERVENKTKLRVNLNSGRKAEIKIMPDTADKKAVERLGGFTYPIYLKEVGKGDNAKPVYEYTNNKQGKFLGIFKIMARVQAQVDAETGDVKVIKPWWAFLASGI